jgi:uncharacterized membrane protein YqaE (UPF0057 family)
MAVTCYDVCVIVCCIIFPPLGVLLDRGCGCALLICFLLTLLGYIPGNIFIHMLGIIYALYIVTREKEEDKTVN